MTDDFLDIGEFGPSSANSLDEAAAARVEKDIELRRLTNAYRAFVTGKADEADVRVVMDDLATFCRFLETTHEPNGHWPQQHLEGRRSVYLRILEFSKLSAEDIFNRYHKRG